jgi:hypothetical protein
MMNSVQLQQAETATISAGIADKQATGAASISRVILISQIGRLHKHVADFNAKRAKGVAKQAIGDLLEPLEKRAGVNTGTFARLASISRALFDKYGAFVPMDAADIADADKLAAARKGSKFGTCLNAFEKFDGASNARKFAQSLKGVKVDKTDKEREQDKASEENGTSELKIKVADDYLVSSLEWLKAGRKIAKDANVDFSKFLTAAGLHEFKKVKS